MAEYYAVERSPEHLAHYGVRGMKWGVRKAIERGDRAALSKQYQKAVKKLGKLSMNANQGFQKERYAKAKANMIAGAGMSAAGSAALTAAANPHADLKRRALYSLGAGAAGAVAGALANSQGFGARRYVSDRGHAKAIAKRDQWRRDLEDTFKGTPYGGRKMHKFHNEITRMSDVKDINGYVQGQYRKSLAEHKRIKSSQQNGADTNSWGREYYIRNKARLDKSRKKWEEYDKRTNNRRFRQRYD